jgi:phosphoserine phosphatase RsbU/P
MQQTPMPLDQLSNLSVGMMERYAQSGDVLAGLRWALPEILHQINAQAGSLFLLQPNKLDLQCMVCHGPVDITGIRVPVTKGLVGQAFQDKQGSLIADARSHANHHQSVDDQTGFVTQSILTVPIVFGETCFGCLQAINRLDDHGEVCAFETPHLEAFHKLSTVLGIALQNVDLAGQLVQDALIKKDLKSAEELQSNLFLGLNNYGCLVGQVIPARNLSGDFIDYFSIGDEIVFCQGDVSGKGIPAALTVARCLALFRLFAKSGQSPVDIAKNINTEIYELASRAERSAGFVTFFVGTYNPQLGEVKFVNCGHGEVLLISSSQGMQSLSAGLPPLGIEASEALDFHAQMQIVSLMNQRLFVFSDGVLEAQFNGKELGLTGVAALARAVTDINLQQALTKIMDLFAHQRLSTADDASLMILGQS